MKRRFALILAILALALTACGSTNEPTPVLDTADAVIAHLTERNAAYVAAGRAAGDVSQEKRTDTAEDGQQPYAVVITCSDSRVPPEHIFAAGIGELFVIRTAGNVIGEYELGSVEYGAEHLGTPLVLVLGHTQCGAVDAALSGGAHGNIKAITDEISAILPEGCEPRDAEVRNVRNSIAAIGESEIMQELVAEHGVKVVGAIYDIESGLVEFLEEE